LSLLVYGHKRKYVLLNNSKCVQRMSKQK